MNLEFRECKNCWQDSTNLRVKIVYQNPMININGYSKSFNQIKVFSNINSFQETIITIFGLWCF
jgi:hypothetical protein